jgi:hypothetical protein
VIRLRAALERGLRNRWIGPALVCILAVILVFLALHALLDHAPTAGFAACMAIAIFLLALAFIPRPPLERVRATRTQRGPPLVRPARTSIASHTALAPLRL